MSISWNASLPIRADGDVAGDRDHRDGIEEGGPDPGHEVRRARPGRAHADADLAGDPGVAVGGVGAALLVADEDVAQLGVVAEDVVEGQDHAARVAEEDVDALEEERLADDVGPDPGPASAAARRRASPAGPPRPPRRGPSRRPGCGCAAPARVAGPSPRRRRCRRLSLRHRHRPACPRSAVTAWRSLRRVCRRPNKKPSPPGEGPFGLRWFVAPSARPSVFLRSPAGSR